MTDEFWRAENTLRHDPIDDAWTVVARNRRVLAPEKRGRTAEGPASAGAFSAEDAIAPLPNLGERSVGEANVQVVPSPTPLVFVEQPTFEARAFVEGGALGAHELVVVKSAANDARVQDLDADAFAALFELWGERARDLAKDIRLHRIGFSLGPPSARRSPLCAAHVVALPLPPKRLPAPVDDCVVCAALDDAKSAGRVVADNEVGVAMVPFAPRSSFHIRVMAEAHGSLVADASGAVAAGLGTLVAQSISALDAVGEGGDISVEISPVALRPLNGHVSHVVIDIVATEDVDASAFRAQGLRVCPLAPEDVAAALRGAA